MFYPFLRSGALKACWFLLLEYFSFSRSIDLSEALELPGVVDVITAEDIPGTNGAEDDKLLAVDEVQSMLSQMTLYIITKVPPPAGFQSPPPYIVG